MDSFTIKVEPEHFDRLDVSCLMTLDDTGTNQYCTQNCPLAQAIRGAGYKLIGIAAGRAMIMVGNNLEDYDADLNSAHGVELIRERLLGGEKSVLVEFYKI